MKICIITPIYEQTTSGHGATPVVHYFAKEWVKQGHEVVVYNLEAKYPKPFYVVGKLFQRQLSTRLGTAIPTSSPTEFDTVYDGVEVHRRTISKIIPHSRFAKSQIDKVIHLIKQDFAGKQQPDYFIGHWDNPCLEILNRLKTVFHKPIALVFHSNIFTLEKTYGEDTIPLLKGLDVIGFRNAASQRDFESKYFVPEKSFIAYSGVADVFLREGNNWEKKFSNSMSKLIYIGLLINRKYPVSVLQAAAKVYKDTLQLTYIGDGAEKQTIEDEHSRLGNMGNVVFTGRIPREQVIDYLKQADVFVMISKAEVFGLVYLEAMALGVIPIGSRGEGIDGIIRDGYNGFLCEAGNTHELESILQRIKVMKPEELKRISDNAKNTAIEYSDRNVAKKYLEGLF